MGKTFTWVSEQDQIFTAEYGTQSAGLNIQNHAFGKIPGKSFTMHKDTKGITLTLSPKEQVRMAFPWDDESDGNVQLSSMTLNNGTLALEFLTGQLGDDLSLGFDGPFNLTLSNSAKLKANNFQSATFSKYCTTYLNDESSIELPSVKHDASQPQSNNLNYLVNIESAITLNDSSSLTIKSFSTYINGTISCSGKSTVDISSNNVVIHNAEFIVSDSTLVTISHEDVTTPVFDFENKTYGVGLFSFHKKPDIDAYTPVITFTATAFNQIIMNSLLKNEIIKNNYKLQSLKWKSEGGNKYSIGPKV